MRDLAWLLVLVGVVLTVIGSASVLVLYPEFIFLAPWLAYITPHHAA
jgi:hypothetical protein